MHATKHVAMADRFQIFNHRLIASFGARLGLTPDGCWMRSTSHDREAILCRNLIDLASQECQFLQCIMEIEMDVRRDFKLGLEHFAHRLATRRPASSLEKFVRGLVSHFQGAFVSEEIFFLDSKRIFRCFATIRSRPDDEISFVRAKAQLQKFEYLGIKSHEPASILLIMQPAKDGSDL